MSSDLLLASQEEKLTPPQRKLAGTVLISEKETPMGVSRQRVPSRESGNEDISSWWVRALKALTLVLSD